MRGENFIKERIVNSVKCIKLSKEYENERKIVKFGSGKFICG